MKKLNVLSLFLYIRGRKGNVSETELLRRFMGGYKEIVRGGLSEELFHLHFALYHNLYRLADRLAGTPYYLHIENMFVSLLRKPGRGRCVHFDETIRGFCGKKTVARTSRYCYLHGSMESAIEQSRSKAEALRNYYLNPKNDSTEEAIRIVRISRGMFNQDRERRETPAYEEETVLDPAAEEIRHDSEEELAPSPYVESGDDRTGRTAATATALGYNPTSLQYSVDRLERRYWHLAKTYEDVCTGFIGDFTEFNRAYSILSRLPSDNGTGNGLDLQSE